MSSLPYPPQLHKGGHHSITIRGELIWQRALIIAVLSTSLIGLASLFDNIPDYLYDTLEYAGLFSNVSGINKGVGFLNEYAELTNQFQGETRTRLIDIAADLQDISSDSGKLLSGQKLIRDQLVTIEGETAGIDATSAAIAANVVLMWQQNTNLLAKMTIVSDKLTNIDLAVGRMDEVTVQNSENLNTINIGVEQIWTTQKEHTELLTRIISILGQIETAVTYEEETFRKRVRRSLIGTTMIATTEYEAGGQCDILPEECTLVGETETEIEDLTWVPVY